ncbi:MAG: hypothetical protein HKN26_09855, partial [Acidimicrobiales bacterium]|nr:hypothetical protein [Acidimicrobiales bacterium]
MSHAELLRASSDHLGRSANVGCISNVFADSGVPLGPQLLAIADAVTLRDPDERDDAIMALTAVADIPATIRAIAVSANFQLMNRLLDGLGVDLPNVDPEVVAAVGFEPA